MMPEPEWTASQQDALRKLNQAAEDAAWAGVPIKYALNEVSTGYLQTEDEDDE
jgi:hypothetical protein